MKLLIVVSLIATLTTNALAYYMPGQGRWMSRDPIGERGGNNLYALVSNDLVGRTDVLGLWGSSTHMALTQDLFNSLSLDTTTKCKARMLSKLKSGNTSTDTKYIDDNEKHFNRPAVDGNRSTWAALYDNHLANTWSQFYANAGGASKSKCKKALSQLGMILHGWQDFFAHAYHEEYGWYAWSNDAGGTPSSRAGLWPSSYPGEHPGGGIEPVTMSHSDFAPRRNAARYYNKSVVQNSLNTWLENCKTDCEGCWIW